MMKDKKWHVIDEFIESLVTQIIKDNNKHKYQATVALAELLFKIPNIDAILYPGIATSLKSINLCMQPNNADRIFKPVRCTMIEIVDRKNEPEYGFLFGWSLYTLVDK